MRNMVLVVVALAVGCGGSALSSDSRIPGCWNLTITGTQPAGATGGGNLDLRTPAGTLSGTFSLRVLSKIANVNEENFYQGQLDGVVDGSAFSGRLVPVGRSEVQIAGALDNAGKLVGTLTATGLALDFTGAHCP